MSGQISPLIFWSRTRRVGCSITRLRSGTTASTGTGWVEMEEVIQLGMLRQRLTNNLDPSTNSKQRSPNQEWPTSAPDGPGSSKTTRMALWRSRTPMTLGLHLFAQIPRLFWVLTSGSTPTTLTIGMEEGTTLLRFGSWWTGISSVRILSDWVGSEVDDLFCFRWNQISNL